MEDSDILDGVLEFLVLMTEMLVFTSDRLLNTFPSIEDLFFSDSLTERGRVMMG